MKNILHESNDVLMETMDLPINHGKIHASESMQQLNDTIYDIIHENDEFSQEFIDKMERLEKERNKDIENLDDLFL